MVMPRHAFLIDGSFIIERAHKTFFGTPLLVHGTKDNTFTFGFVRDFLRLRQTLAIQDGALVIGREAQSCTAAQNVADVITFLREARIPFVYDPLARASNIIGVLRSDFSHIVTADPLLLQFLAHGFGVVLIADTDAHLYTWMTRETLHAEIGVDPEKVLTYLTLILGLGASSLTKQQAARLVELYGDLDSIYQAVPAIASPRIRKVLASNEAQAREYEAENAIGAVPRAKCYRADKGMASLASKRNCRLLAAYGFHSLRRLLARPAALPAGPKGQELAATSYTAAVERRGLEQLRAAIKGATVCAIDTESDGKDPRTATLLGVAFSVAPGTATFVSLVEGDVADMTRASVAKELKGIFDSNIAFIGHNIKFDYLLLRRSGVKMKAIHFDTMLAAAECHGDWDFFNLGYLCQRLLGKKVKSYKDVVGENRSFLDLPLNVMVNHAGQDADMTLRLYPILVAQLNERLIATQYFEQTVPLIARLGELECQGIPVKTQGIDRVRRDLMKQAAELKATTCCQLGGDCDLDSLKDVTKRLEVALGRGRAMESGRLTKAALENMARTEPVVRLIVRYKRLRRQIAELESIRMAVTGWRIHPQFNQIRSPAGVVATDDPCLLSVGELPSLAACFGTSLREFFIDKQLSLDLLARATGDPRLQRVRASKSRLDSYLANHPLMKELDQHELLLSCAIGYSDATMSRKFLVGNAAISGIRCDLRRRYPVLFRWLDSYRSEAEKMGYVTFDGTRKYIDGLRSSNLGKRARALENVVRWLIRF